MRTTPPNCRSTERSRRRTGGGADRLHQQQRLLGQHRAANTDSGFGKTIEALAQQHNVVTIDYGRLTAGGTASDYVSYDNVKVGEDQGTALTLCRSD